MKRRKGKVILACCLLAAIAGGVAFAVFGGRPKARGQETSSQDLTDIGAFKVGYQVGMERAGFSGRIPVIVFADVSSSEWSKLSACLASAEVNAEMMSFTGVLVNTNAAPEMVGKIQEATKATVLIQSLSGPILGLLPSGFNCDDLIGMLRSVRQAEQFMEKSPAYASLLESAALIRTLKSDGQVDKAMRFVELLEECEGVNSPAVQAALQALSE